MGPLRKKVWPLSNFSFFGVICTTEENLSVSMCLKKFNITRIDPTFREKNISNYQQIKVSVKPFFYLKLADTRMIQKSELKIKKQDRTIKESEHKTN